MYATIDLLRLQKAKRSIFAEKGGLKNLSNFAHRTALAAPTENLHQHDINMIPNQPLEL